METLKLIALDEKDLKIISSLTQDAIIVPTDLTFDAKKQHFILPMRRFAWEKENEEPTRKNSVLRFLNVTKVQSKGVGPQGDQPPLSLLAINSSSLDNAVVVSLTFAKNVTILLYVEALELELQDLGASWSASRRPNHGK